MNFTMAHDVQLLPRGTKWLFVSTIFCRNFINLLFEVLKLHHRRERSARGPMITNRTTIARCRAIGSLET
jgi:hypothetical protein